MVGFLFGGTTGLSYDDLQDRRKRQDMLTAQILGLKPKNTKEGIGAILQGIGNGIDRYQTNKGMREGREGATSQFDSLLSKITGQPSTGGASANLPMPGAAAELSATAPGGSGSLPGSFLAAVDRTEGAGGYDTLYGNAQRGGQFAGVDVSKMTVGDALAFSDPNGAYAQSVKGKIGRVATPMGRHQIVGKTLRNAVAELGLDPSTPFNAATQDNIALHLAKRRVASANTLDGKIDALRSEWHGFKNVPRQQMAQIVADIENGGGTQVASLDPAAGMSGAAAIGQQAPGSGYVDPMVSAPNAMPQNANMPLPNQSQASNGPMLSQQPQQQAALPAMQPPQTVSQAPQVAAQPQQMAQAQMPQQPQPFGGVDPQILQLMNNPFLAPEQRQMLQSVMEQQIQANDPMRRLQMQKLQQDLTQPDYDIISGKDGSIFRADKRAGTVEQVYGGKPDTFRVLSADEKAQFGLDPSQSYQVGADNKISKIGGEGTTVNIDQRAEGAFDKKLAENQATTFDTMATEGLNARADLGVINELDALLQGQGGTLSGLSGALAKYGIGGEGIGDIQAAQALINKLVPSQRAPGSGSMSDRDVELFTRSLPSLWNTPGGNARIIGVMRGLTEYKQQQGEIADQVLAGEMTRQEARRALRSIPNPLSDFKAPDSPKVPAENPLPPQPQKSIDQMTDDELRAIIDGR